MVWLIWAFPHRLGESAAPESLIKKWGTVLVITVILAGGAAYLIKGPQPKLVFSDTDLEKATTPMREELSKTRQDLENAKKEISDAMQCKLKDVSVSDQSTYVRLQFNKVDGTPVEVDSSNIHWTTFKFTWASKQCLDSPYNQICTLMPPKGNKDDFGQRHTLLTLAFDRPITYTYLKINAFGAKVESRIDSHTDKMAVIYLIPDNAVTSYIVDVRATQ